MTVAYLTHPLGDADADWGSGRGDNIANAIDWFRFLRRATRFAICYPTMAYVAADSELQAPSELTGQVEIMSLCHLLVIVGGRLSGHMRVMISHAIARARGPLPIMDLLHLGRMPPWARLDEVTVEILATAARLGF